MEIQAIWQGTNQLGEGPVWHPIEKVLYWVDIVGKQLHRLDTKTEVHQAWPTPDIIGCIAPHEKGGLVAAIGTDIVYMDLPSGEITRLISTKRALRLNDGQCDAKGRLWLGEVDDAGQFAGYFYCYDHSGKLQIKEEGVGCSNGLAWNQKQTQFYYTDSFARKIYAYDFELETAALSNRRVLVDVPEADGWPDGMTIDLEDCLWSAAWEGHKIIVYTSKGEKLREIPMPVARPTSCAFGGSDLKTLFVTSCSKNVDEKVALASPAGQVFAIPTLVAGRPANVCTIALK